MPLPNDKDKNYATGYCQDSQQSCQNCAGHWDDYCSALENEVTRLDDEVVDLKEKLEAAERRYGELVETVSRRTDQAQGQ